MGFSNLNILLIEDNEADRMIIQRCLSDYMRTPWGLEYAQNMSEAERLISANPGYFNLVVLDLGLPDTDGKLEALIRVQKACKKNIPILVLTGADDNSLAVDLIKLGAGDYIPKSYLTKQAETLSYAIDLAVARFIKYENLNEEQERMIREKDAQIDRAINRRG